MGHPHFFGLRDPHLKIEMWGTRFGGGAGRASCHGKALGAPEGTFDGDYGLLLERHVWGGLR
jgi:hypothetical protein